MPSPLISVIVPIYNMESLLPRCLDSLAAQTLRDLEIICVDDGSTDGSGGIVRKYASGDSRFRLITQENSGRAEARNAGIRAAAAPYLGFADPDDYVEPDMYERLYRLAEESGADMVQCSYSPFLPAESGESRGMAEENSFILKTLPATASLRRKEKYSGSFWKTGSPASSGANCSGGYSPAVPPPWKSACLLPSPAEKTPFTFPGPSPAAAASPSPLKTLPLRAGRSPIRFFSQPESGNPARKLLRRIRDAHQGKLREGVLGSNRTAYMNYIVPLLFPDNEMPAGRLRHWAELWREADITSEHVCGMPREQRAYLEAALAGRWIYLRLLQCFWKFKTARRKMFRLRFSKNGIDTLQILGYTLYSAKKFPRSSL